MKYNEIINKITDLILYDKKKVIKAINDNTRHEISIYDITDDGIVDIIVDELYSNNYDLSTALSELILKQKKQVNWVSQVIGAVAKVGSEVIDVFRDKANRKSSQQLMKEQLKLKQLNLYEKNKALEKQKAEAERIENKRKKNIKYVGIGAGMILLTIIGIKIYQNAK